MQQDCPKIPGTPAIDGASERRLTEAYRLLAEVYQLLSEYSPLWYPEDLHYRLQAALRSPDQALGPRTEEAPRPPANSPCRRLSESPRTPQRRL